MSSEIPPESEEDTNAALDAVADRLGALYQYVGRLEVTDCYRDQYAMCLNEVIALTEEVERIRNRSARHAHNSSSPKDTADVE